MECWEHPALKKRFGVGENDADAIDGTGDGVDVRGVRLCFVCLFFFWTRGSLGELTSPSVSTSVLFDGKYAAAGFWFQGRLS